MKAYLAISSLIKTLFVKFHPLFLSLVCLGVFALPSIGKRAFVSYLMIGVFIIVVDSFLCKKCRTFVTIPLIYIFHLMCLIEVVHVMLFNDRFDSSSFFILLETNMDESLEFIHSIFNFKVVSILVLNMISFLLYLLFFKRIRDLSLPYFRLIYIDYRFYTLFVVSIVLYKTIMFSFPYKVVNSFAEYTTTKELLSQQSSDILGGDFTNVSCADDESSETYVLVVGESTSRRHLGLYGYDRQTSPLLSDMSEDLFIFKDVISPHTHTIASLGKVLTLSSFTNDSTSGSIIQLFNKAGFETYWISNQKPIGMFETSVTTLSNTASHRSFVNANTNRLDSALFKPYEKALHASSPKKLIILHLMGTHLSYDKRYPEEYDVFAGKPYTQFPHAKAWSSINTYDNAVLYNDFIVSSFIKKLEKMNTTSFLLYLSDHGEEVFHDKNFAIHAEYNETKDMYDVPFIVWASEDYLNSNDNIIFDEQRSYNTENLIHTFADMANISFSELDSTRSLVNKRYVGYPRYITEKKIYEDTFH